MSAASAGRQRGQNFASITVRRRIEWIDTDAAGIYHWTTVCRLAEAAEATLHTALGIEKATFGFTPRVGVSFEFSKPLRFNDLVEVRFMVDAVGRTSVRYAISVMGSEGLAAEGLITACFIDAESGRPSPWPEEVRRALTEAGSTTEEASGLEVP